MEQKWRRSIKTLGTALAVQPLRHAFGMPPLLSGEALARFSLAD